MSLKVLGVKQDGSDPAPRTPHLVVSPVSVVCDEDTTIYVEVRRPSGEPYRLTEMVPPNPGPGPDVETAIPSVLSVKKYVVDASPLFSVSGTNVDAATGLVKFVIPKTATKDLDAGIYYYDVVLVGATAAVGRAVVVQSSVMTLVADPSTTIAAAAPELLGSYTAGSGVVVRKVVYVSGANTVGLADASIATPHVPAIGVVRSVALGTASVVGKGEVGGFSGLTPGAVYYLDPAAPGGITATQPATPGQKKQRVGVGKDASTLMVDIDLAATTV